MTGIPTPYTVRVRERRVIGQDDYGNDRHEWVEATWPVSVIGPGDMEEPPRENREQSNVAWTLYGPKHAGYPRDEKAQVCLPGDSVWYELTGAPADYTQATPWTPMFPPPYVVKLLRVKG